MNVRWQLKDLFINYYILFWGYLQIKRIKIKEIDGNKKSL